MERLIEAQVQAALLQRANNAKWFLALVGKSRKQPFDKAPEQTEDGEALCWHPSLPTAVVNLPFARVCAGLLCIRCHSQEMVLYST